MILDGENKDGLLIIPIAGTTLALLFVGSGTIWALVDVCRDDNHKRQFKHDQTDKLQAQEWITLSTGTLLLILMPAFLVFGAIAFVIFIAWSILDSIGYGGGI